MELRVQGAGCRVQDAGCWVQDAGCRVQGAAKAADTGFELNLFPSQLALRQQRCPRRERLVTSKISQLLYHVQNSQLLYVDPTLHTYIIYMNSTATVWAEPHETRETT